MSFVKRIVNKYGKNLTDATTKTGIDPARTASKRVVQKMTKTTGDLIANKIADKITSLGKRNKHTKELQQNERQEIYIQPEKRQKIIDDLRLF